MRKYSLIMMAFALLLGMAQCKKEQVTPSENNGVNITLKVDGGSEKLEVYPATGAVIFTTGDEIYVGNNGKYVGTLAFENGLFQGTISGDLSTDDNLHFYFVGNKSTSPTDLAAGTTTYTVDISDQSAYLPAISYAPSKEKYSPNTTAYTAKLLNKSALVKFVPSVATNHLITISGLNNEVEIDFANHTLTPTGTTGGITLYSVSETEKWAILLEQTSLSGLTVSGSGFEATIDETTLPSAITNNMYYNSGVGISMTVTGAVAGKFTVAAGKQVCFSQGNLQYIGSAGNGDDNNTGAYWKFAEEQWEYLGTTTGQFSDNKTVDRDLFGWGTSGYNHGATCYQPWSTSTDYSQYNPYNSTSTSLYDSNGQADWGYEAIVNGGNGENYWRTLTGDEWNYVFYTRTNAYSKNGKGNVNGVNGMILLPDDWTLPEGLNFTSGNSNWANNVYTAEQWAQMEYNGAVFLPVSDSREGVSLSVVVGYGFYWSSSYGDNTAGKGVRFDSGTISVQSFYRHYGFSVRLVRNV